MDLEPKTIDINSGTATFVIEKIYKEGKNSAVLLGGNIYDDDSVNTSNYIVLKVIESSHYHVKQQLKSGKYKITKIIIGPYNISDVKKRKKPILKEIEKNAFGKEIKIPFFKSDFTLQEEKSGILVIKGNELINNGKITGNTYFKINNIFMNKKVSVIFHFDYV